MPSTLEPAEPQESDDFALGAVPASARLPWHRILNVTIGIAGAMIFLQVSGQMALTYGTANAILANVYATVATGFLATGFAYVAAQSGLNSNLIARGTGYGFVGAALTSLIYASNFIVLAAIEGSIIAQAIHAYMPTLSISLLAAIITVANIALNWYGMKQLDKFQKYSFPVYLLLLGSAIALAYRIPAARDVVWFRVMPPGGAVGGVALLTCVGILNGIVGVQSVLTADYARFIKPDEIRLGSIAVGIAPQLASFFMMGLVGSWFGVRFAQANPGIYMVAVMGAWGAAYTVLSQLRINVINIYSGSLSLSNFFERIFHFRTGRALWVIAAASLAFIAMIANVLDYVGPVLTFQGVFMFAWAASMMTDLIVVKQLLRIGPAQIEYRPERLRRWNPVGTVALVAGSIVGGYLSLTSTNALVVASSAFIAGLISSVTHVAVAVVTRGKYYLADAA